MITPINNPLINKNFMHIPKFGFTQNPFILNLRPDQYA
jgi:hypothetical protein